jgi:hypothetical protein
VWKQAEEEERAAQLRTYERDPYHEAYNREYLEWERSRAFRGVPGLYQ